MSLFNTDKDFNVISNMIPTRSSVIDVGCGDGSLLKYLDKNKNINGRGLEIDQDKIRECLAKGISVIQGDADVDLADYPDKSFDYSILTYTLQATKRPKIDVNIFAAIFPPVSLVTLAALSAMNINIAKATINIALLM